MRTSTKVGWGLALLFLAAFGWWIWWLMQPPPIETGDRRWCAQIAEKPTDAWTAEEALGYARENCMRWHFLEDLDKQSE